MRTMKAIYIDGPGRISLRNTPAPVITEDDDVILKICYTGICGSDLHAYLGENPFVIYPRVFGHEFCGKVISAGRGVTDLSPGDLVVGEPIEYCGECYPCRRGHPNVCEKLKVLGVHADGGGREYIKMSRRHVFKVPDTLPAKYAVLAEPLTIGFRCCTRGEVAPDDCVLIMGAGTIGLCAMLAAKQKGATVIITDLIDEKLAYAANMGADHVINAGLEDVTARVLELTDRRGANVVVDGVGSKKSLEQAIDLASAAGRIVELNLTNQISEITHKKLCQRDLTLCGTRLQAHEFPEAIDYLCSHWENMTDFITDMYPPERAEEAFEHMLKNGRNVRKLLISF